MIPGIHEMSMEQYTDDPCEPASLSASVAYAMHAYSALHARQMHPKLSPDFQRKDNSRAELGSSAHRVLLEGTFEGIKFLDFDDYKKKAAQEGRDEARLAGQIPVLLKWESPLREMVLAAREALAENQDIEIDLADGDAERTLIWKEDGFWMRARPDWMSRDRSILLNYKTAANARPETFINRMAPAGYDFSAAFYERGMKALGHRAEEFFLAQEIEKPYACSIVGLSPGMREIAERKVDFAIALWKNCMQTGKWRGYANRVHYAEPTAWQVADHEIRGLTADEMIELGTQA